MESMQYVKWKSAQTLKFGQKFDPYDLEQGGKQQRRSEQALIFSNEIYIHINQPEISVTISCNCSNLGGTYMF